MDLLTDGCSVVTTFFASVFLSFFLLVSGSAKAAPYGSLPESLPDIPWQLTVRPWQPLAVEKEDYLERIAGIVDNYVTFQNTDPSASRYGAIIDPYARNEVQYSTPYFAMAAGTLLEACWGTTEQRSAWLEHGSLAMDRATADLVNDAAADNHGEFYIAALAYAMQTYQGLVQTDRYQQWQVNMGTPNFVFLQGLPHNWRTYAMKGDWLRAKFGLIPRQWAVDYIETYWDNPSLNGGRSADQRERLTSDDWHQYHDRLEVSLPPETFAYDTAARNNLFSMVFEGYDGPSRQDMLDLLLPPADISLCFMDPSGQAAASGRSGNHVWNDVVYGNIYERLAEYYHALGDEDRAGQFRRAAMLTMKSTDRFRQSSGLYSVTKNQYSPADRVWFASYSYLTNYNGYCMFHMSESARARKSTIQEKPTPVERGGYVVQTNVRHSQVFANAGGMQLQASMHGTTSSFSGQYWSALGILRFSRVNWDSRLGPSDGCREYSSEKGVSFAPAFYEDGNWIQLADVPDRYEGVTTAYNAHPLLTRLNVRWQPRPGKSGPVFDHELTLTPNGVLSILRRESGTTPWAQTWPLLEYDGKSTVVREIGDRYVSLRFPDGGDRQNFLCLNTDAVFDDTATSRMTGYGKVQPYMVKPSAYQDAVITFIYPSKAGEYSAAHLLNSMQVADSERFSSVLSTVADDTFNGTYACGGSGSSADFDRDGTAELTFSVPCQFIAKHADGDLIALEADRPVTAQYRGQNLQLTSEPLIFREGPFQTDTLLTDISDSFQAEFTVTPGEEYMKGTIRLFDQRTFIAGIPAAITVEFTEDGLVRLVGADDQYVNNGMFAYQQNEPVFFRLIADLLSSTYSLFAFSSSHYQCMAASIPFAGPAPAELNVIRSASLDALLTVSDVKVTRAITMGEPIKINFQLDNAALPEGYLSDNGTVYGEKTNGMIYGWSANNTDGMRERDQKSDQRLDTLAHMQLNGIFEWEISVPNGTWNIEAVAGDSGYYDSTYDIAVEELSILTGRPTSSSRYITAQATVEVTDGRLTLSNGLTAENNKICYIILTPQEINTSANFGLQTKPL